MLPPILPESAGDEAESGLGEPSKTRPWFPPPFLPSESSDYITGLGEPSKAKPWLPPPIHSSDYPGPEILNGVQFPEVVHYDYEGDLDGEMES